MPTSTVPERTAEEAGAAPLVPPAAAAPEVVWALLAPVPPPAAAPAPAHGTHVSTGTMDAEPEPEADADPLVALPEAEWSPLEAAPAPPGAAPALQFETAGGEGVGIAPCP